MAVKRYELYARKDLTSELMAESNNIKELRPIRTAWREQIKIPSVYPHIFDTRVNDCREKIKKPKKIKS